MAFSRPFDFWATVCRTVRPMLSDRCPVLYVCPVCDVGVLWPNGWMDQDETWHGGRPWPWPHCVRSDPAPLSIGHSPTLFGPCLLWPKDRPSQLLLSTCMFSHVSVISVKINIWSYLRTYCSVLKHYFFTFMA